MKMQLMVKCHYSNKRDCPFYGETEFHHTEGCSHCVTSLCTNKIAISDFLKQLIADK
jgi:hypothetical protein